jgi:hypothetical protein
MGRKDGASFALAERPGWLRLRSQPFGCVIDQVDSIERHKTEVLAYLPNAEFKIIKGSGHLIPIDEPVRLAKRLQVLQRG